MLIVRRSIPGISRLAMQPIELLNKNKSCLYQSVSLKLRVAKGLCMMHDKGKIKKFFL